MTRAGAVCQPLANVIFGGETRKTTYTYVSASSHEGSLWYRYCMLMGTGQASLRTVSQLVIQGTVETATLDVRFRQGFLGQQEGNFSPYRDLQYC